MRMDHCDTIITPSMLDVLLFISLALLDPFFSFCLWVCKFFRRPKDKKKTSGLAMLDYLFIVVTLRQLLYGNTSNVNL